MASRRERSRLLNTESQTTPVDPDLVADDAPARRNRPVHLHWRYIGLVFAGGTIGTTARYLLSLAVPTVDGIPVIVFAINVVGAFALGWLLATLARRPDQGIRRVVRLFVGTGVLGGFTTYSSFAVDTDGLIVASNIGGSIAYAIATLVVGALASLAGIALGTTIGRRRASGGAR